MRDSKITTNFTAGEVSPRLLGRTDLKKYHNGVSTLENFLIQVHGGIERRPGTRFVREAHVADAVASVYPPRLVEFQFNVDQSYVLEFGVTATATSGDTGYIRFFRLNDDGDPIILIDTTGGGTEPTILSGKPFNGPELAGLQFTQSADVLYIFSATRAPYVLKRIADNDALQASWTYTAYEFNDGPYLPMNSDDAITLTPSATAAGTDITITSAGGLYFSQDDVGRHIRIEDDSTGYPIVGVFPGYWDSSDSHWSTPATIFVNDGGAMKAIAGNNSSSGFKVEFLKVTKGVPILNDTVYSAQYFEDADPAADPAELGDTKFQLFHPDTGEAIGWPDWSNDGENTVDDFFADEINGECRFERATHVGWGRITVVPAGVLVTTCTLSVIDELPTINATTNFRLGAWSKGTGYPKTGRFYQDRLWTASTTSEPQTIWSTATGDYNCYAPTTRRESLVIDTSAITVTLADAQVNDIKYLAGDTSGLIVLTSGGEWLGRATSSQSALTPTDLGFQKSSTYGSASNIIPIRSGTSLLFVQRDNRVIRELTYEFGQDRFVAPNITLLSEHITGTGIIDAAYQQGRSNRVWYVRNDGELLAMTYEKTEEVMGWQRHKLAQSNDEDAVVLSVATTLDSDTDNTWVLVKRDINGTDRYYIEMMSLPLDATGDHDTAIYLDSSISGYDASGSQTWDGLDHLIGENVTVLADAVSMPDTFLVDGSGEIDLLTVSPDRVVVGLKYDSVMETLPIVLDPTRAGGTKGNLKRAYKYFINLYRTLGGKAGTPDQVYPIEYPTSTSTVLNTRLIEVSAPDNSSRETIIRYEQSDAQPATILSIVSEFNVGGN